MMIHVNMNKMGISGAVSVYIPALNEIAAPKNYQNPSHSPLVMSLSKYPGMPGSGNWYTPEESFFPLRKLLSVHV